MATRWNCVTIFFTPVAGDPGAPYAATTQLDLTRVAQPTGGRRHAECLNAHGDQERADLRRARAGPAGRRSGPASARVPATRRVMARRRLPARRARLPHAGPGPARLLA